MVGFRTHESWFSLLTIYTVAVSVTSLCKQLCVHVGELTIIHTEQKQTDHTHTHRSCPISKTSFLSFFHCRIQERHKVVVSHFSLCVCVCVCVCVVYKPFMVGLGLKGC